MIRVARTLFAKIFAWFWITVAMLLMVIFAGSWLMSREPRTTDPRMGDPFRAVVETADDLYRSEGMPALVRMVDGIERRGSITPYLIAGGRELRGRSLPPAVLRTALAVERSDSAIFWDQRPRLLLGYPLHGAGGERLALVLVPRPLPRPLGVLVPIARGGPWMLVVLVIVTGLVCLLLVRALIAPVKRLRDATRRLASGDLAARVGHTADASGDELESLAADFDSMAERIERLVGTQRQLLRDISHELRSPLARMSVAIGLAREKSDERARPMLDRIELESERLNALIGQLLVMARLDSEGVALAREPLDLGDLVDSLVEDARFEARPAGVIVTRSGLESLPVRAHAETVRSAIENVIRNALRHSPAGGEVRVEVRADSGAASVIVADHGPGVPADQLEAIFLPFHRIPDAGERSPGGTGLGLAIASRALAANGGSVVARNAEDGGLEVELRLPR